MKNKFFAKFFLRNIIFLMLFIILLTSNIQSTGNVSVYAKHIYYTLLDASSFSTHWAGIKIINNANPLEDQITSFTFISLSLPLIVQAEFPGANLKDDIHYYAAMLPDINFSLNNIHNTSESDLTEDQLFSQAEFPTFYPDYNDKSDNPSETFISGTDDILIGGINFTALKITTSVNVDYYLLKYNNSGDMTPLFIVPFKDCICYNETIQEGCVAQFMLPVNSNSYHFYILSKYAVYEFDTYIDEISSATFAQTALPYILRVDAKNLYTGSPAPNLPILVGEDSGQNIFIPYRLSGYVSKAYSIGETNSSGSETFLVAPTVYPSSDNYSIYVAAFPEGIIVSKKELFITEKDSLVRQSKPLSPSSLHNNAIVSINAMSSINSCLYRWASIYEKANKFRIEYDLSTGNFTTYRYTSPVIYVQDNITMKTGAPNVFLIYVENNGTNQSNYTIMLKETDGYLIVNPYVLSSPLDQKERRNFQESSVETEFIVTPTSLER